MQSTEYGQPAQEIRASGRYIATVSGILQGTYFAAISLGEIKKTEPPTVLIVTPCP